MFQSVLIAVDLGGTKCHGVISSLNGTILAEARESTDTTDAARTLHQVWRRLQRTAIHAEATIAHTVVGVPAVVDASSGRASRGPNIGWRDVDLSGVLSDVEPVTYENDARLAALGELRRGRMKGVADFALLSIGTGFGGALVTDGLIVSGAHGGAGEFGEMLRDGGAGTVEDIVSGRGLTDAAVEAGGHRDPSPRALLRSAYEGDARAAALVTALLEELGRVIGRLVFIADPEAVVIDGGLGRSLEPFADSLRQIVVDHAGNAPEIVFSRLQPTSTIAGALTLGRSLAEASATSTQPAPIQPAPIQPASKGNA